MFCKVMRVLDDENSIMHAPPMPYLTPTPPYLRKEALVGSQEMHAYRTTTKELINRIQEDLLMFNE